VHACVDLGKEPFFSPDSEQYRTIQPTSGWASGNISILFEAVRVVIYDQTWHAYHHSASYHTSFSSGNVHSMAILKMVAIWNF